MRSHKKVKGIGGVFFKSKDPEALKKWYSEQLGFFSHEFGAVFETRESDNPEQKSYAIWSLFKQNTQYFEPSNKEFMINYIVEDIEELVEMLKENGVTILDEIEDTEYGKFVHITDPENNKIELWEPPVGGAFEGMYEGRTIK